MIVVPAAVLLASVVYTMKKHSEGQSIKKSLRMNAATFAVMVLLVAGCAMGAFATGSELRLIQPPLRLPTQSPRAQKRQPLKITPRVSDFLPLVLLPVLPVSAAVSQLPPALPQLSLQRARIPRHSVKRLSSSPSVSR